MSLRSHGLVALALALTGASACVAGVYPAPVDDNATVYVSSAPPNIYAYPHVWYDGGYAYLVDGRWYYPSRGGWVVFRREPPELYRYRTYYVQRAPPAYPAYPYRAYPNEATPPPPPPQYGYPPPPR